ncbi:MAG TPA: hypothetical protein VHH32_13865, partial [Gemmatimonadales bacterium]|nr:hypothetical protein [Gemmatimonadales bacterium]
MDDRLDDQLSAAARDYNQPPETPREAMWERIVAERTVKPERAEQSQHSDIILLRPVRHLRPLSWAAGIAAILALGIGIGRLSVPPTSPSVPEQSVAHQPRPRVNTAAYEVATAEYLSQSEAFLTLFRASLRQNAGESTNRLLLDSPAAQD